MSKVAGSVRFDGMEVSEGAAFEVLLVAEGFYFTVEGGTATVEGGGYGGLGFVASFVEEDAHVGRAYGSGEAVGDCHVAVFGGFHFVVGYVAFYSESSEAVGTAAHTR